MTNLLNPFTPSEIAATPELFYGRNGELRDIEKSLKIGSVLIQGPVGIGKSSLLARTMDLMTGFNSAYTCQQVTVIADRNLETIEQAARLVLDGLGANINDQDKKLQFKLRVPTGLGEFSFKIGADLVRSHQEGRHLAVLKQLLERDFKRRVAASSELLLIGVDEADKSPIALSRLIRSLTTQLQQAGIRDLRFVLAGVSPLHQQLVSEDPGVQRVFNRVLTLRPMSKDEAEELMWDKLSQVVRHEESSGRPLTVGDEVVDRMVGLSGGHPHILQLLGSHLIQHEEEHSDGVLAVSERSNPATSERLKTGHGR